MEISELTDSFFNFMVNTEGGSPEGAEKYRGNIRIICKELGISKISELDPETINEKWVSEIWNMLVDRRGIANNTVIGYQSALKKFLLFLEKYQLMPTGIHEQVKLAKPHEVHLNGLSMEEKKMLRDYISCNLKTERDRRDAALCYFLLATGCRISEALRCDVHGDCFIYAIPGKRSGDFSIYDGEVYVHIKGKGHRERDIPVASLAISYINMYLETRSNKNDSALFHTCSRNVDEQKRIGRRGAIHAVDKLFERSGIKTDGHVTHVFRHTAIEKWIKDGYSVKKILSMTGQKDEKSLEHYFRRSRDLTKVFANEGSPLNDIPVSNDIYKLESILVKKYFGTGS